MPPIKPSYTQNYGDHSPTSRPPHSVSIQAGTDIGLGPGSIAGTITGDSSGSRPSYTSGSGVKPTSGPTYAPGINNNYGGNSNSQKPIEDKLENYGPGNHLSPSGPSANVKPTKPTIDSGFNVHVDTSHTDHSHSINAEVNLGIPVRPIGHAETLHPGSNFNSVRPTRIPETQIIDSTSDGSVPLTNVVTPTGISVGNHITPDQKHGGSNVHNNGIYYLLL